MQQRPGPAEREVSGRGRGPEEGSAEGRWPFAGGSGGGCPGVQRRDRQADRRGRSRAYGDAAAGASRARPRITDKAATGPQARRQQREAEGVGAAKHHTRRGRAAAMLSLLYRISRAAGHGLRRAGATRAGDNCYTYGQVWVTGSSSEGWGGGPPSTGSEASTARGPAIPQRAEGRRELHPEASRKGSARRGGRWRSGGRAGAEPGDRRRISLLPYRVQKAACSGPVMLLLIP